MARVFIPLPKQWRRQIKQALLHAIGLERLALSQVRAGFEHSSDPRAQMAAELDRLCAHIRTLEEEIRIKDARLRALPALKRPHYPPPERLAILLLKAKMGWNAAETARRFGVTAATILSWMRRLDEQGPDALVQTVVPVNRFDDGVTLLAHQLHQAAPRKGRKKLAALFARAGFQLAASTVRRRLKWTPPRVPPPEPKPTAGAAGEHAEPTKTRVVTARELHHVWHVDLSAIAIGAPGTGLWAPWWPFALVLRWVLSWHMAFVLDHFSRALIAFALFRKEPTAREICGLLDRAVREAGRAPRYIVSDQGSQFQTEYGAWCARNGVKPRFGAIGQHGSIAVIERFVLSLKSELLWRTFVPASHSRMQALLEAYQRWYNEIRPHEALGNRTPAEARDGVVTARPNGGFEPRASYPLARDDPSVRRVKKLELCVEYVDGFRELPIVELREAA